MSLPPPCPRPAAPIRRDARRPGPCAVARTSAPLAVLGLLVLLAALPAPTHAAPVLVAPAVTPPVHAARPHTVARLAAVPHVDRWDPTRPALQLLARGERLAAWNGLLFELAAAPARWTGADDGTRDDVAASAEVAALFLSELTGELELWPELLKRLEALGDRSARRAGLPAGAAFRIDALEASALRSVGRVDEARALTRELGWIQDLILCGPFDNERGSGFLVAYPPESGVDRTAELRGKERDVGWRDHPVDHPLGRILLSEMLRPSDQAVAYLATGLHSETERDVALGLGTSGPFKVFLDGAELASRDVQRPRSADQDRVLLPLRPGWNTLLVKLAVEDGSWSAELRLTAPDGSPATGVEVASGRAGSEPHAPRATDATLPDDTRARLAARASSDPVAARELVLYHLMLRPDDRTARRAREVAEQLVAQAPEDPHAWFLLARAAEPLGATTNEVAFGRHLEALREVLERDPDHLPALLHLADFYVHENPIPTRADELTTRAVEIAPTSWDALSARAQVLGWRGRRAEADLHLRRALESAEGRLLSEAVRTRAERLRAAGDDEGALATLREGARRRVNGGRMQDDLIALLVDTGRIDEAVERTDDLLAAAPYALTRMLGTGRLAEYAGRPYVARGLYHRVLEVCPDHTGARLALVRLAEREGNEDAAAGLLAEVLELDPGNDEARRHLSLLGSRDDDRFESPWRWDAAALVGLPPRDGAANDPVEVLRRTTVWRVHADGTEHRYEHIAWRALTEAGVEDLDTYVITHPSSSSLQVYNARVLRPDGSEARASGDAGRRWRSGRSIDLPPLTVGDVVDIEYRIDESRPDVFGEYFGIRHGFYPERIDGLAPTRRSELVVLAPPEVPLHVAERNADGMTARSFTDERGLIVREWVVEELDRPPLQTAMPERREFAPGVDVTTFADWNAFATWYWSFIEKEFQTTDAMREKVAELTAGLESEAARVEAIARFVGQEIRYNAWPFGTHGYEPYSAPTIFERRFGDCKDKSILLRQLLAEIGVEAVPVLIRAQSTRPDEPLQAAMVEHFNHCIAYLEPTDERDGYYLDATADRNPVGYLRADDQGARVLHVTPEGGELHDIPFAPAGENTLTRRYAITLDERGRGLVRFADESNGQYGVIMRYRYGGEQGDAVKGLAGELGKAFGQVDIASLATSDLEDITAPAQLQAEFTTSGLWTTEGDLRSLPVGFDALGLDTLAVERPEVRLYDLVLDRPFGHDTRVRWELPPGSAPVRLPPDVHVDVPGLLEYRQEVREIDGALEVHRRFALHARRIALEDYAAFREALREVQVAEQRTLLVTAPAGSEGGR